MFLDPKRRNRRLPMQWKPTRPVGCGPDPDWPHGRTTHSHCFWFAEAISELLAVVGNPSTILPEEAEASSHAELCTVRTQIFGTQSPGEVHDDGGER